jgi:hypothetical protein
MYRIQEPSVHFSRKAIEYVLGDEVKGMRLNGREIRNGKHGGNPLHETPAHDEIQQFNWQSFSFERIKPMPEEIKTTNRQKWGRNLLRRRSYSGSSRSLIMAIFGKGIKAQGLPPDTIGWTGLYHHHAIDFKAKTFSKGDLSHRPLVNSVKMILKKEHLKINV